MTYYQLLKQRRIDLNLSIGDVSSQTRLAPEYIQAIEEHNLDVFSDDFSFVRYFVHAYCDAIGVNWAVVQEEVDADIHAYARMRNHALTQAQRRIATSMQPESSKTRKKKKSTKKRGPVSKAYSFISYKVLGTKKAKYNRLFALGIIALLVLCLANVVTDVISDRQEAQYEKQQEEEYQEKEKETEQLAKQYQQTKEKKAMVVSCLNSTDNVWLFSNIEQGDTCDVKFEITLPSASIVNLYQDGNIVSDGENTVYSESFSKTITVTGNCIFQLEIGSYTSDVKITVNGNEVTFNTENWYEGQWAEMYFKVQYTGTEAPLLDSEKEPEEDQEDYYYEDGIYYFDDYYYDENTGEYYYY